MTDTLQGRTVFIEARVTERSNLDSARIRITNVNGNPVGINVPRASLVIMNDDFRNVCVPTDPLQRAIYEELNKVAFKAVTPEQAAANIRAFVLANPPNSANPSAPFDARAEAKETLRAWRSIYGPFPEWNGWFAGRVESAGWTLRQTLSVSSQIDSLTHDEELSEDEIAACWPEQFKGSKA